MTSTMTCQDLVSFLLEYEEGTLAPDDRARFEDHLRACPECVVYLEGYRRALRLGKAALVGGDYPVPPEVPEGLVQAILAARRRE